MKPVKAALLSVGMGSAAFAQQQPLSAIDWLDEVIALPIAQPHPGSDEPAVATTALSPEVSVLPLDTANADAVGLLPSSKTGLPQTLWVASATADLNDALAATTPAPLPALQALYYTLLLAEADAPTDAPKGAAFLLTRTDALIRFGAVDAARALLERAGPQDPVLFDRWLDLTLLDGTEDAPCKALRDRPALSENYAARIYCTARAGDWPTAALTYESAVALDALTPVDAALLALYLDPETIETSPPPSPPRDMSPLTFRLFEAAGSPYPTVRLPRAFAMADLRETAGWRTEIEAAERLARTGALPANRLLGLYTDRKPAASGGVWDRVRAIQAFDTALHSGDPAKVAETLPGAWQKMRQRGLETAFAQLFADDLKALDLPDEAADIAFSMILLSDDYERSGERLTSPNPQQQFLIGLAAGAPDMALVNTSREAAIAHAFATPVPASAHADLINAGKLGEAILVAANQLDRARGGNLGDMTDALVTLRALGLEDTARRAALQILILGAS